MRKMIHSLIPFGRTAARQQRSIRNRKPARRRLLLEQLESRLTPANLNINAAGVASFAANPGELNDVSLLLNQGTSRYEFTDSGAPITVSGAGAGAAFGDAQGAGTNTVTVKASFITSISIETDDLSDFVTIRSNAVPTTVTSSGGNDTVTIGNAGSVQGITGTVNVTNPAALSTLTVDDSTDTTGHVATVSDTSISGLAPATITFAPTDIGDVGGVPGLTINGGAGNDSFTVTNTISSTTTELNAGGGNDNVTVQAGSVGSTLNVNGQNGNDSFVVTPSADAIFNFDGGPPTTTPGDTLLYNGNGTINPSGPGAGTITAPGVNPVTFTSVESVVFADVTLSGSSTTVPFTTYQLSLSYRGVGITSVTIHWGDGTSDTLSGTPATATHVFGDLCGAPSFTISASVTTPSGTFPSANTLTVTPRFATPTGRYIGELFCDLLGRAVDQSAFNATNSFLTHGGTRAQLVQIIQNDPHHEFQFHYVETFYETLLHRTGDPTGLQAGVAFLLRGGTAEQFKSFLVGSTEYFNVRGGGTNSGFTTALFNDTLGRAPDSAGSMAVQNYLAAGGSRTTLAFAFLTSTEGEGHFVTTTYQALLQRTPDANSTANLAHLIQSGFRDEQLIAVIVASDEYFNLVSQ